MLDVTADFENWQAFGLDGEPYLPAEGAPVIPQVSRFYRIPNTGSVDLVIGDSQFRIVDDVNPYPYQPEDVPFRRDSRDPVIYTRDAWYPESIARISEPMIFRDFRVVQVTLCPVQVNPVTRQARIYENIDVEIVANDTPGENETPESSPAFRQFCARLSRDDSQSGGQRSRRGHNNSRDLYDYCQQSGVGYAIC